MPCTPGLPATALPLTVALGKFGPPIAEASFLLAGLSLAYERDDDTSNTYYDGG
jgi:hypothetical protein